MKDVANEVDMDGLELYKIVQTKPSSTHIPKLFMSSFWFAFFVSGTNYVHRISKCCPHIIIIYSCCHNSNKNFIGTISRLLIDFLFRLEIGIFSQRSKNPKKTNDVNRFPIPSRRQWSKQNGTNGTLYLFATDNDMLCLNCIFQKNSKKNQHSLP